MTAAVGVEGNRRLTAALGAVLLVLLAVEGGTIPFLSQLEVVHVIVGLILLPIVLSWRDLGGNKGIPRPTYLDVKDGMSRREAKLGFPMIALGTLL
jgi:hypothetical protein